MVRERKTPEQKLAELEQAKRQLEARIKSESAKVKAQERKDDTRRKILAGAVALEHAQHDSQFKAVLDRQIAHNVPRDSDRALFGLPPLTKPPPSS